MDITILGTIVSAIVAIIGVVVSIVVSRWTIKLHNKEVDLKSKELDTSIQKIANDVEAMRQSQFSETLRRRADCYPKLWSVIIEFTKNWDDDKPQDVQWVKSFLIALNKIDAEFGVFFSQAVYEKFHALQYLLYNLTDYPENKTISDKDLSTIDLIFRGRPGKLGLAGYLKDDLGSYRETSIQKRNANSSTDSLGDILERRKMLFAPSDVFYSYNVSAGVGPDPEILREMDLLREGWLERTNAVLLIPTTGIRAITSILENDLDFRKTADILEQYLIKILDVPNKKIEFTEPLLTSRKIIDFDLIEFRLFIEKNFGVEIEIEDTLPSSFDTLLELTALVCERKNRESLDQS